MLLLYTCNYELGYSISAMKCVTDINET